MNRKKILILGAGKSAYKLIQYLSDRSEEKGYELHLIDRNANAFLEKLKSYKGKASEGDVTNEAYRRSIISEADLVISMLPVNFHVMVAKECISQKKHMVTASYVSPEMEALNDEALAAGITILNEIGLDPGIDHMSAMQIIESIRSKGGEVVSFESFTGGLIAPESEGDNPWKYKFTWNPRNVVLASAGSAVKFIDNGMYKYIPYHRVFRRTELVDLGAHGKFEGYANRDSLKYRKLYGLDKVQTMYRGTFRRPGFCKAWDIFVQLGATDDTYTIEDSENMTNRSFINSFLKYHPTDSVELKLMHYMKLDQDDTEIMEKLEWLDIFKEIPIGLKNATPAQILQHILEKKWSLRPADRDMIVMWHKFIYQMKGVEKEIHTSMVVVGDDQYDTAMAKTVGLPVAIATEMILDGQLADRGVLRPLQKNIYDPVLLRLQEFGIVFEEKEVR